MFPSFIQNIDCNMCGKKIKKYVSYKSRVFVLVEKLFRSTYTLKFYNSKISKNFIKIVTSAVFRQHLLNI